eukprot:4526671-Prymnesium_polylepis.2
MRSWQQTVNPSLRRSAICPWHRFERVVYQLEHSELMRQGCATLAITRRPPTAIENHPRQPPSRPDGRSGRP